MRPHQNIPPPAHPRNTGRDFPAPCLSPDQMPWHSQPNSGYTENVWWQWTESSGKIPSETEESFSAARCGGASPARQSARFLPHHTRWDSQSEASSCPFLESGPISYGWLRNIRQRVHPAQRDSCPAGESWNRILYNGIPMQQIHPPAESAVRLQIGRTISGFCPRSHCLPHLSHRIAVSLNAPCTCARALLAQSRYRKSRSAGFPPPRGNGLFRFSCPQGKKPSRNPPAYIGHQFLHMH